MIKLSIFGAGYVGLVTVACFAQVGNHVTCVDVGAAKIEGLNSGILPIYEEELSQLVDENLKEQCLSFTTDSKIAVEDANIIFIAVGSPATHNGAVDLSFIMQVAKIIANHLNGYKVIVNKSTAPVGTVDLVRERITQISWQNKNSHALIANPSDFHQKNNVLIGKVILYQIHTVYTEWGNWFVFLLLLIAIAQAFWNTKR